MPSRFPLFLFGFLFLAMVDISILSAQGDPSFLVLPSDTIEKQSIHCPEEFPFMWGNISISGPGTYQETFENENGGITDTIWIIESYPQQAVDTSTHIFCEPVENCPPGTYELFYPGANMYGCDSSAVLVIIDGEISTLIDFVCQDGEFILYPLFEHLGYPNDELEYAWYTCDDNILIFDESHLITTTAGCYYLVTSGLFCQDTAYITITGSLDIQIQQVGQALCIDALNPQSVKWYPCADTITLSNGMCFEPSTDGCYCVDVTVMNECTISDCYDFMVNTINATDAGFAFFPNPSAEAFSMRIPGRIQLPLEWNLFDDAGKSIAKGKFEEYQNHFFWPANVTPGHYEMILHSEDRSYRLGLMRVGK